MLHIESGVCPYNCRASSKRLSRSAPLACQTRCLLMSLLIKLVIQHAFSVLNMISLKPLTNIEPTICASQPPVILISMSRKKARNPLASFSLYTLRVLPGYLAGNLPPKILPFSLQHLEEPGPNESCISPLVVLLSFFPLIISTSMVVLQALPKTSIQTSQVCI